MSGATLENFDEPSPSILTLSGAAYLLTGYGYNATPPYYSGSTAAFFGESPIYGYDNSQYVAVCGGTATLSFSTLQNYLGLLWGSVDTVNSLTFYDSSNNVIGTVTGTDILGLNTNLVTTDEALSPNGTAYVNITSTTPFSRVVASNPGAAFEIDDVAYAGGFAYPFNYTDNGDGTATITGYTGSGGDVTIPSTINGLSVTSIGDDVFNGCTNLTSVAIPNSVTSIRDDAFAYCTSLTSVTFGNSVTSIGDDAFNDCTSLTSVTIPNSVTSIGQFTFNDCSGLTDATIASGAIGDFAFADCSGLTSVMIGNSVTSIGQFAFNGCSSLTDATIASGAIGDYAFADCSSLTIVTIGNNVASIGDYAFYGCSSLTDATIASGAIRDYAFADCSGLTIVTIGNNVASIGDYAFYGCSSLTDATIASGAIGDYAFAYCTSLTSVTIPNSVTSIGDGAFSGCTSLTSVYFQGNAPSVGSAVFGGDNNATVYYLPGTTGWGWTFGGCPTALWPPQVFAGSASSITANSATLNGSVNPNGSATTYYFQLGTGTAYGTTITPSPNSVGSGTTAKNVYAQNVSYLNPNTIYHFRLVASSSAGTAYGADTYFTTLSGGTPLPVISPTYSTLTLAPSSQLADGSSQIIATATLRDVNDSLVTNRTIQFSAAGQAAVKIANSTVTTGSDGVATTTITATTPGTSTICLIDPANFNLITSATATFTQQGYLLPNSTLSSAITTLYLESASTLNNDLISIAVTATNAGAYGDIFRANINQDDVQGALGPFFDLIPLVPAVSATADFASLLDQPGILEVGPAIITDNAQLSYLFDEGLSQGQFASQVLPSVFNEFLGMAQDQVVQNLDDAGITYALDNIGQQANGLSSSGQNIATACTTLQQGLLQQQQSLLNQGVPASTDQAAWANDLTNRIRVAPTFEAVLIQGDQFLGELYACKQQANQNAFDFMLAKFAIQTAATIFLDGPGALVAGSVFAVTDAETASRTLSGDQTGYNASMSLLIGCSQYAHQTYRNTTSAYGEISESLISSPATGQIGSMADWEDGYAATGLFGIQSVFSATNAYSLLDIQNTSSQATTFEIFVLSQYAGADYGIPVANLNQVSTTVTNIPGEMDMQIPIVYYDGQNGGKPNPSFPMVVYVLGNNQSGTFYIGGFSHNWSPTLVTNGSVWQPLGAIKIQNSRIKPLDDGGSSSSNSFTEIENPVSSYVTQNPTNQTYQARIFVVNPFGQTCSAIVTQALPSGVNVLTTDGALEDSAIIWTNVISTNVAEDTFTFTLSVAPGAQTNLPPPTVTFFDQSTNQSSPFNSTTPGFNGLFPVQISSSIPVGVLGIDSTMLVAVTNLTGTSQSGSLTVTLTDSSGNPVTNFLESFSLDGSDGTNLSFTLPGSLSAGSYSLTGSLSINGGTGQVLAGNYVVPAPPVALNLGSTPALTTNGLNVALQGPTGNYLIEASSDLSSSTNWQPILFYSSTNASFYYNFSVPMATNANQQFYRAVMQ